MIQTYTPKSDVITCAARQDYDSFYELEIEHRRLRRFPPFRDLYVICVSGADERTVLESCIRLRDGFYAWRNSPTMADTPFDILGPAPASVVKVMNRYRYTLTLGGKNCRKMRDMIGYIITRARSDRCNKGISILVDTNPMDGF